MEADDLMLRPLSGAAEKRRRQRLSFVEVVKVASFLGSSSKACLIVGTREHKCMRCDLSWSRQSFSGFLGQRIPQREEISQGLQQNPNADLAGFVLGSNTDSNISPCWAIS